MRVPLDRQSGVPLYRQIETYLRQQILCGGLAPETRLPATRQLADDLGISRITAKNAYAALESDGLISTREGSGTYVAPTIHHPALPTNNAETAWPLWQLQAQVEDARTQEISLARGVREQHPHPIAFMGVGDPEQFPITDFY